MSGVAVARLFADTGLGAAPWLIRAPGEVAGVIRLPGRKHDLVTTARLRTGKSQASQRPWKARRREARSNSLPDQPVQELSAMILRLVVLSVTHIVAGVNVSAGAEAALCWPLQRPCAARGHCGRRALRIVSA